MKLLSSLLLFAGLASAQVLSIATGSPVAVGNYAADEYFSGGIARPLDSTIGTGIYQTTRYSNGATPFFYHIPVPVGIYSVVLRLNDPTSTTAGQRIFTVAVNGTKTAPIDIFAAVGVRKPYSYPNLIAVAATGFIDLTFQSLTGNATVSGIDIYPYELEVVTSTNAAQVGSQLITLVCVLGQPCTLSADLSMLMIRAPAPTAPGACQGLEFAIDANGFPYTCGPNKTWLKGSQAWSATF